MNRILTLFLIINFCVIAQSETVYLDSAYSPRQSFGLFFGGGLNFHVADFERLPQTTGCCDGYSTGSGLGIMAGAFYSFPLGNTFELDLRLNYMDLSGRLTKTEERDNSVLNTANDQVVNATIEHEIDATINAIAFEPSLIMKLGNQLRLRAGISSGYIITKDFTQQEEVTNPSTGVFIDQNGNRSRVINTASGEIPEAPTLNLGILFGASFDLPLNKNKTWFIVPEARYTLGLTSLHANEIWLPSQFAGGIGIRYAPRKKAPPKKAPPPPPPPPPVPLPPPPPAEPSLDATIAAVSVDENGREYPVSLLKVEEFYENNTHPLLNYVFFEENSAELPPRYQRISKAETKDFRYSQFFELKTLDVYYHILNIIGKRMQFYPQAELTLVGTNSNKGKEKGNLELSRQRAQSIKDYLVNVWDIRPDRLKIEARNLPELPSNATTAEGSQENRRVEIIPNFDRLFEPIVTQNTFKETNPPNFRFKPDIKAEVGVSNWEIVVKQGDEVLRRFNGSGDVPSQVDWTLADEDEQSNLPDLNQSLDYKLVVTDNDGKILESDYQTLPVEVRTIETKIFEMEEDMEIDKLSMIGFGFNKDELNETNKNIADKAKLRVRYNSNVDITGHSDRLGNADRNMTLSKMRAERAAERMDVDKSNAKGLGETVLLYDNDLPEGRFYSRTVRIKIETPIEAYEDLENME